MSVKLRLAFLSFFLLQIECPSSPARSFCLVQAERGRMKRRPGFIEHPQTTRVPAKVRKELQAHLHPYTVWQGRVEAAPAAPFTCARIYGRPCSGRSNGNTRHPRRSSYRKTIVGLQTLHPILNAHYTNSVQHPTAMFKFSPMTPHH